MKICWEQRSQEKQLKETSCYLMVTKENNCWDYSESEAVLGSRKGLAFLCCNVGADNRKPCLGPDCEMKLSWKIGYESNGHIGYE